MTDPTGIDSPSNVRPFLRWWYWNWEQTWGVDFPFTAMTATRLHLPEQAIESLFMNQSTNTYLVNRHNYQDGRLQLYLPGIGVLLSAIAMMCAGFEGNTIALFNNAIDRKVFNVEQDIMSKAGSVSELLQNIPSVEVDIEGNVSLRGSTSVLILIDGKNSPLMGRNRASVLQQLPASTIEKIEVITNPSTRYKPEGTSGIINLIMKKNTALGANGSITLNAGTQDRYNGTLQLNYNPGSLNLFGNYGIRRENRNRNVDQLEKEFGLSLQYEHKFPEEDHTLNIEYKLSLQPDHEDNRFTSVTYAINDSMLLTTEQNLSNDQSAGMELIISANANDLISSHFSSNVFYNQIDASNLGYSSNRSTVTWRGALTVNINPTATTMIQLKANYNSARLTPQGNRPSSHVINAGLRQDLWDKKVSMILTVADLFKTVRSVSDIDTPTLLRHTVNKRDSQIFYFGLVYYFGAPPKKSKEELLKYDNTL